MSVHETLRLAQANAVDDRGVVELIGDNGVLIVEQHLKYACIRVKTRCVENGIIA